MSGFFAQDDREVILHIGRHKTGTSSLQAYLKGNANALAKKGILYPKTGRQNAAAHVELTRQCTARDLDIRAMIELRWRFALERLRYRRCIISSEGLQNLTTFNALDFVLGAKRNVYATAKSPRRRPFKLTVVCYFREMLEYAASAYAQRIHATASIESFDEYCGKGFALSPHSVALPTDTRTMRSIADFCQFWELFSDEVRYRYYHPDQLINRSIIDDFFATTKIDQPAPPPRFDSNPSIAGNLLAFKLFLNHCAQHSSKLYYPLGALARQHSQFRGRFFISSADAEALRSKYASFNEDIAAKVGDLTMAAFESYAPVPSHDTWKEDLQLILSEPGLEHLANDPAIRELTADHVAATISCA